MEQIAPGTHSDALMKTACELADSRTDEFPRTCLAIVLYIFKIILAVVPAIGGEPSSPPTGRIGLAMIYPGLFQWSCSVMPLVTFPPNVAASGFSNASPKRREGGAKHAAERI